MPPISNKYFLLALLVLVTGLTSCEKTINITLASSPPLLVVDGAIETNIPPYVVLTTTIGFFSTANYSTLENSFVHGANVQVSDGTTTITLKEYTIDTGNNAKIYVYSIDTTGSSGIMLGQVGKYYTLTIAYNGATYTSVTKIPPVKGVDSLYFGMPVNANYPDSAVQLFVNYTDPDTPGNYVRYFTRRNQQGYFPSGIFSDELVNGQTIKAIALYAGYPDSTNANGDSLRLFYPGDSVYLKWCEIDKGVYTFWNTEQFAQNAIGNPFSSPINITSNISNGALGVWAGYSSIYYSLAVPH